MPRREGQKLGPYFTPPNLAHYTAQGHDLGAGKLTQAKRQLAKSDHAVAEFFRQRIREAERFAAFMSGRMTYPSDTPCPVCSSTRRRVYAADCAPCQNRRRPLRLDSRNKVASWPQAQRTRASFLDINARRRRAKAGEVEAVTFGDVQAWKFPDGRLTIEHRGHVPPFRIENANDLPPAGAAWLLAAMQRDVDLLRVAAFDHWRGAAEALAAIPPAIQ
jgi:hypothetical protein